MKKIKNIFILALAVLMAASLFSGCVSMQDKLEELSGTWTLTVTDSEEQAMVLLEGIDLYEEEIAFVDMNSLEYVQIAEFTLDKTYRFAIDAEATKECVRAFYEGVFASLYENRTSLNETYEQEFDSMTEAEFQQFYADLYDYEDFTALMDRFTESAYDYEELGEDLETGTFTISGGKLLCITTGETEAESLGFEIDGTKLTLTYSDAVHVYTREVSAE